MPDKLERKDLPALLRNLVEVHGADEVTLQLDAYSARALADDLALAQGVSENVRYGEMKVTGRIL